MTMSFQHTDWRSGGNAVIPRQARAQCRCGVREILSPVFKMLSLALKGHALLSKMTDAVTNQRSVRYCLALNSTAVYRHNMNLKSTYA